MRSLWQRLQRDERGATAVEYGLLVALMALAALAAINSLADETIGMWGYVSSSVAAVL